MPNKTQLVKLIKEVIADSDQDGLYNVNPTYHTHNGIDSPQLSAINIRNISTNGFVTGAVQSNSASPITGNISAFPVNADGMVSAVISAQDSSGTYSAGFIRNCTFRVRAGVITIFDQIQDAFTMRDRSWNADFTSSGNILQVQVYGESSTTINWHYSVNVVSATVNS